VTSLLLRIKRQAHEEEVFETLPRTREVHEKVAT
jgi:hypothetical protein